MLRGDCRYCALVGPSASASCSFGALVVWFKRDSWIWGADSCRLSTIVRRIVGVRMRAVCPVNVSNRCEHAFHGRSPQQICMRTESTAFQAEGRKLRHVQFFIHVVVCTILCMLEEFRRAHHSPRRVCRAKRCEICSYRRYLAALLLCCADWNLGLHPLLSGIFTDRELLAATIYRSVP